MEEFTQEEATRIISTIVDGIPDSQLPVARMTVSGYVYYQSPDAPAKAVEIGYSRIVDKDQQLFERHIRISEQWQQIETGWLRNASIVTISNEPDRWAVIPSKAEMQEAENRVIEVGILPSQEILDAAGKYDLTLEPIPFGLVRPRCCFPLEPANLGRLYLRSRFGTVRCTIVVIPEHKE